MLVLSSVFWVKEVMDHVPEVILPVGLLLVVEVGAPLEYFLQLIQKISSTKDKLQKKYFFIKKNLMNKRNIKDTYIKNGLLYKMVALKNTEVKIFIV